MRSSSTMPRSTAVLLGGGPAARRAAMPAISTRVAAAVLLAALCARPHPLTAEEPAPARMTIAGRVLDPAGQPVPGANVMVLVRSRYSDRPMIDLSTVAATAHDGRCNASGRFRIDLPRTTSARHDGLIVIALAPGHGVGWAELDPDADPPVADVALRAEQVIRGRLFDVQGRPAAGVTLRVESMNQPVPGETPWPLNRPDLFELRWDDRPAWPGPTTSDADGRFTLRGLGRGLMYGLAIDDPRFSLPLTLLRADEWSDGPRPGNRALSVIQVEAGPDPKPITIALQPPHTIIGRVTDADTDEPIPHAVISTPRRRHEADAEGRFRVDAETSSRGYFTIRAQAPDEAPYLAATIEGQWPKGAVEHSIELALPRGVVVRGRITEEGTGRPVAGAVVRIAPSAAPDGPTQPSGPPVTTGPDGSYRLVAPPGPGYVVAQGPQDDYVLREFGAEGSTARARPGRNRFYAHAYRAVDLKPGGPGQAVDLAVRPGAAVRGRVVDPDGQPVRLARVYSRLILSSRPLGGWKQWGHLYERGRGFVRDGRFALHGLDPDAEVPAYFLDRERKLGATARFTGRPAAGGPIAVRLEPCGTARARLVGPDGKPLAGIRPDRLLWMVITPGPPARGGPAKDGPLFADEAPAPELDRINHPRDVRSDAQGRVAFPALIPGAPYRVVDQSETSGDDGIRKEFTVKPGETLDLGDILIARPRRSN